MPTIRQRSRGLTISMQILHELGILHQLGRVAEFRGSFLR